MSDTRPLHELSARELRAALDAGELTSAALVDALLARADAVNAKVNALVHRFDDQAREAAREADARREAGAPLGPLDGLPLTIKESMQTAGVPVTLGIPSRQARPVDRDAVVVQLVRESGGVILGKGNVPQLLMFHETDNPLWGRTLNPWNPDRVPGGSSGGEAAALAVGITPLAVGTDIGGSIRVPAAFSGVAGLKPTAHRWSNLRSHTALAGQEVVPGQCGPMARTAADVAFLWQALDGPRHAALDPAVPPLPTADPAAIDVSTLRVGVFSDDGYLPAAASLARAVREAGEALAGVGVDVVEIQPVAGKEIIRTYFRALSSDGGATVAGHLAHDPTANQLKVLRRTASLPAPVRHAAAMVMGLKGERRTQEMLQDLGAKPVRDYWAITAARTALRNQVFAAWAQAGLDAVICPAHATPALAHEQATEFSMGGCYSMRYNLLNFPAGVVPVGRVRPDEAGARRPTDRIERTAAAVEQGSAGLPLGVQIAARPYREDLVLALMLALEDAVRGRDGFPTTPLDP